MIVYNEDKTKELLENEIDLTKGYLYEDKYVSGHTQEQQAVLEQGHYETIKEYPNGGKDVKWVVDVEGVEYKPSQPIYEDCKIYVAYTEDELKNIRISEIKERLNELSNDLIQFEFGAIFEDIEARKTEFRELHNELRYLLGKQPREYR